MSKRRFRPQEKQVLKSLLEHNFTMSTTQVARRANVSWNTANKYLREFNRRNWIAHSRRGKKKLWRAYR